MDAYDTEGPREDELRGVYDQGYSDGLRELELNCAAGPWQKLANITDCPEHRSVLIRCIDSSGVIRHYEAYRIRAFWLHANTGRIISDSVTHFAPINPGKGERWMSDPKYESIGSRLDHLVEECAEVIMAAQKIKRFGLWNYHPERPQSNNAAELIKEMRDLKRRIEEVELQVYSEAAYPPEKEG